MAENEKDDQTPAGEAGDTAGNANPDGGTPDGGPSQPQGDAAQAQGNSATEQGDASQAPQAAVLAQYVKDLSFENPNAAQTLQQLSQGEQGQPRMEININVGASRLGTEAYEVEIKINAAAKLAEDQTAYAVELVYAGLMGIRNVPDTVLEQFLLVQTPHILFPFARRIISDTVRDGGFTPLMLEPIDFAKLYQQQRQQAQEQMQASPEQSGAGGIGTIDLGETKGNA